MVKILPAMQETWVQPLDWEDSMEEVMATHPSILACRIPMSRNSVLEGYNQWGLKKSDATKQSTVQRKWEEKSKYNLCLI